MPTFENYRREAEDIEREIARRGLVLGVDWEDEGQVHALAREALAYRDDDRSPVPVIEPREMAKIELFGLAQLMLAVMQHSADEGMFTHGGTVWKTFARALWQEAGSRPAAPDSSL